MNIEDRFENSQDEVVQETVSQIKALSDRLITYRVGGAITSSCGLLGLGIGAAAAGRDLMVDYPNINSESLFPAVSGFICLSVGITALSASINKSHEIGSLRNALLIYSLLKS